MESRKSKSLFDDIFRLQNTAPDDDIDPEDPEDGAKARLASVTVDEAESVGPSQLRKQTAIISDDPKYKGRKTSRKDLYSDEEQDEGLSQQASGSEMGDSADDVDFDKMDDDEDDDDSDGDEDDESSDEAGSDSGMEDKEGGDGGDTEETDDVKILPESKSDDQQKGKDVVKQLDVWDNLIKTRIVLQKLVTASNRLPQSDVWPDFWANPNFKQEAKNVHSSVRKVVSALLDLQAALSTQGGAESSSKEKMAEESEEEITSESEAEDEEGSTGKDSSKINGMNKHDDEEEEDNSDVDEDEMGNEESVNQEGVDSRGGAGNSARAKLKRKLSGEHVEETLAKRHADFQSYRNDTLSKWDEKTRLAHGKIKSKNFAAFEMSVLKQIEQILVNRDRLVRRIHQKRSDYRILGKPQRDEAKENGNNVEVEDDDDDVEVKLKQRSKTEISIDPEIIDDNDFYHVCLRDLIEMKQNEETDPVMASKQWLEIQRLRNKQKQKVDTKASKGRKIRYNVKEKLKNYMTPYDKSLWSDEQKDDLFKAMFGGKNSQNGEAREDMERKQQQESAIILGI